MTHTVQLAVEYADHQTRYYPANRGWRIDAASRCIVVGRDLPRTHIPLDTVTAWRVERLPARAAADSDAVQNLLDDATRAFADADTSSERVEVIRDLLEGWYAAWPSTAVTDEHVGIAHQIVALVYAAEARAGDQAASREQLLAELTGGKRPCPWCNGSPLFDSAEELLIHTRRHHLAPFPPDELVWLGDLSGYQLDADAGQVLLRHRCGWTYEVDNPVIAYLANLIDGPVDAHRDAGCNPHEG